MCRRGRTRARADASCSVTPACELAADPRRSAKSRRSRFWPAYARTAAERFVRVAAGIRCRVVLCACRGFVSTSSARSASEQGCARMRHVASVVRVQSRDGRGGVVSRAASRDVPRLRSVARHGRSRGRRGDVDPSGRDRSGARSRARAAVRGSRSLSRPVVGSGVVSAPSSIVRRTRSGGARSDGRVRRADVACTHGGFLHRRCRRSLASAR